MVSRKVENRHNSELAQILPTIPADKLALDPLVPTSGLPELSVPLGLIGGLMKDGEWINGTVCRYERK